MGEVEFSPAVGSGGGEGSQLDAITESRRCVGGGVVGRREAEVARLAACEAAGSSRKSAHEVAVMLGCAGAGAWAADCQCPRGSAVSVGFGLASLASGHPPCRWQLRKPSLQPPVSSSLLSSSFLFSSLFTPAIAGSC
ncbi:hypothetical protein OsI_07322 [Oryza sativa Indica Group]|uniref:Uncharacterized protein n=1 Tax=Oryza sativa subsp. indica TaxID=39946 RepID=B8AIB5_ORYSI|nr:hypothetical protein OsI_07322 [Oryza sativa Indica Group]